MNDGMYGWVGRGQHNEGHLYCRKLFMHCMSCLVSTEVIQLFCISRTCCQILACIVRGWRLNACEESQSVCMREEQGERGETNAQGMLLAIM